MPLYEAVRARPAGGSTVSRFAATASAYGFDGLVVRSSDGPTAVNEYDRQGRPHGIDVVDGIEIDAPDRSTASAEIDRYRDRRTVVCLHGGRLNRFGAERPRVDVLTRPMRDGDLNHVIAQAAVENGVRLEVNLTRVLREAGGRRVRAIRDLRKLAALIRKYDVPFVVSADASSHLHLRAPRELVAVGEVVGFEAEEVRAGLHEWGRLADRNRDRQSDTYLEPGVRVGRAENCNEPTDS